MTTDINRRQLVTRASALVISALIANRARAEDSCKTKTAEEVTEGIDLTGRTFVLTGCSAGVGRETLRVLVLRGAQVYGLAPTLEKAQGACAAAGGPGIKGKAIPLGCDHVDFPSIVAAANTVQKDGTPIDGLICNAGINLQRLEQVNGIEKDFVVNHLGHFILVNRLLKLVKAAPQGRIVVVGSGAAYMFAPKSGIEFDNLSGQRDYDFLKMYGQSKLATVLFTRELARRLAGSRTTANVLDPGFVDTQMNRNLVGNTASPYDFSKIDFTKAKSPAQGAATTCYVATNPGLARISGVYFSDCSVQTPGGHMQDDAMAAKLWKVSEDLTRPYLLYDRSIPLQKSNAR